MGPSKGRIQAQRLTGDKKYTDKMNFEYKEVDGKCVVRGCSESQVYSVYDFSGNFCNVRMMTCGSEDGCVPAQIDYTSEVSTIKKSSGATTKMSDCLKVFAGTMV